MKLSSNLTALYLGVSLLFLSGCQGSIAAMVIGNSYPTWARNYKPAGFETSEEVAGYAAQADYFAFKISGEEWRGFYNRFPEYWKDLQAAKSITFMRDYNDGYAAYALKWNLQRKKAQWDETTRARLATGTLAKGDDIYKIIYAMGPPKRVLWDNDFDVMLYDKDTAVILQSNVVDRMGMCRDCTKKMKDINNKEQYVMSDDLIAKELALVRPEY